MSVELAKIMDNEIIQRGRFQIREVVGGWRGDVVLHHDGEPADEIATSTGPTRGEAIGFVHRRLFAYFTAFTDEEMIGIPIAWHTNAHRDAPEDLIDLAKLIAAGVQEYLGDEIEEEEMEEACRSGQPLHHGTLDYETGITTPLYTEYPGLEGDPTRIVYADGSVAYISDEGEPVDEHGVPLVNPEESPPE